MPPPATLTPHKAICFRFADDRPGQPSGVARRRQRRFVHRRFRSAVGAGDPRRADYGSRCAVEKSTRRQLRRHGSQRRRRYFTPAQKAARQRQRSPIVSRRCATKAICSPLTPGITKRPFCGPARGPLIARSPAAKLSRLLPARSSLARTFITGTCHID